MKSSFLNAAKRKFKDEGYRFELIEKGLLFNKTPCYDYLLSTGEHPYITYIRALVVIHPDGYSIFLDVEFPEP